MIVSDSHNVTVHNLRERFIREVEQTINRKLEQAEALVEQAQHLEEDADAMRGFLRVLRTGNGDKLPPAPVKEEAKPKKKRATRGMPREEFVAQLDALDDEFTASDVAELTGLNTDYVSKRLRTLMNKGEAPLEVTREKAPAVGARGWTPTVYRRTNEKAQGAS